MSVSFDLVGRRLMGCSVAFAILTTVASASAAASEKVLYAFQGGSDGNYPAAGVIADKDGDLYGTTNAGGIDNCQFGCGTVFKLAPDKTKTIIYSFMGGSDGAWPDGALIADDTGNLYGPASGGGNADNDGTVFRLAPDGTETPLYVFRGGSDGAGPIGNLVRDKKGDLFGTTAGGGNYGPPECVENGCGTVFELKPNGKETVVYTFQGGSDGAIPESGLIEDNSGNLYGTTADGGTDCQEGGIGCGTIFRIAPDGAETILYAFQGGSDGSVPVAGLVMDKAGNLYGTTDGGGTCEGVNGGCGTVFKLAPDGTETVLYSFQGGNDGSDPVAGLVMDKASNLYGTTFFGGGTGCAKTGGGCGTVFKLAPDGTETVLVSFKGRYGINPVAGLLLGKHGELYGTTSAGGKSHGNCAGTYGCGVVFEVTK